MALIVYVTVILWLLYALPKPLRYFQLVTFLTFWLTRLCRAAAAVAPVAAAASAAALVAFAYSCKWLRLTPLHQFLRVEHNLTVPCITISTVRYHAHGWARNALIKLLIVYVWGGTRSTAKATHKCRQLHTAWHRVQVVQNV